MGVVPAGAVSAGFALASLVPCQSALENFLATETFQMRYGDEDIEPYPTPASELAKAKEQRKLEALSRTQRMRLRKQAEADRQAELRAKRRIDGVPDPRLVDAVLVAALRTVIRRSSALTHDDGRVEMGVAAAVRVDAVIKRAGFDLVRRGYSAAVTKSSLMQRLASAQA